MSLASQFGLIQCGLYTETAILYFPAGYPGIIRKDRISGPTLNMFQVKHEGFRHNCEHCSFTATSKKEPR